MEFERLAPMLDALGEAVTIRGSDDRLVFANRAALALPEIPGWESPRSTARRARSVTSGATSTISGRLGVIG
jgi:hypothetical protein